MTTPMALSSTFPDRARHLANTRAMRHRVNPVRALRSCSRSSGDTFNLVPTRLFTSKEISSMLGKSKSTIVVSSLSSVGNLNWSERITKQRRSRLISRARFLISRTKGNWPGFI